MKALLDVILEWILGNPEELTPEQRARFIYLGRQLEAPDAIDAELEADARDRSTATTVKVPVTPPTDSRP